MPAQRSSDGPAMNTISTVMPWILMISKMPWRIANTISSRISFEVIERAAVAHRVVELLVEIDEVGLDAHQEHRHARHDRTGRRGTPAGRRSTEWCSRPTIWLAGVRVVPEHDLVDPDAEVVEEPGERERDVDAPLVEEIEADEDVARDSSGRSSAACPSAARSGRARSRAAALPCPCGRRSSAPPTTMM